MRCAQLKKVELKIEYEGLLMLHEADLNPNEALQFLKRPSMVSVMGLMGLSLDVVRLRARIYLKRLALIFYWKDDLK